MRGVKKFSIALKYGNTEAGVLFEIQSDLTINMLNFAEKT